MGIDVKHPLNGPAGAQRIFPGGCGGSEPSRLTGAVLRGVASRRPTWTERYRLGVEMNRHMDPICTLEELGAELGITRQNAYTETVLALGTLAWHLREYFDQE